MRADQDILAFFWFPALHATQEEMHANAIKLFEQSQVATMLPALADLNTIMLPATQLSNCPLRLDLHFGACSETKPFHFLPCGIRHSHVDFPPSKHTVTIIL